MGVQDPQNPVGVAPSGPAGFGQESRLRSLLGAVTFLPDLLLHEPERRVHPCQGTLLCVRLAGLDEVVGALEPGQSSFSGHLLEELQRLLQLLSDAAARLGGELFELNTEGLTFFFADDQGLRQSVMRALAAGLRLRGLFATWLESQPPPMNTGIQYHLGVASGIFHGLVLGQVDSSPQMVFTGAALEEAWRAAEQAAHQEIMLHPSSGGRLGGELVLTTPPLPTPALCRLDGFGSGVEVERLQVEQSSVPANRVPALVSSEGRLKEGAQRSCCLTMQVSGVDPASASGLSALNTWYERCLKVVSERNGRLLRLVVGPITRAEVLFEAGGGLVDLEARTLRCALALQRVARDLPALFNQRLGIASGHVLVLSLRPGYPPCFGALGLRFHQSRRLATLGGPWEILAERQTVSRSGFGFDWGPPPASTVANDQELVTARVLYGEGAYGTKLTSRSRGALVGREPVMARLKVLADEAMSGHGRLVSLVGAPGIGKSALVVWMGSYLQEQKRLSVYRGECSALVRHAPYHAWIPIFRDWLDLQPELSSEDQVARVQQRVASLGTDLLPRLPLLSMVTGVRIPPTPATEALDTRQRREALQALVLEMFRRARRHLPMGFLFEDAHWMDEASLMLLRYVSRNMADLPLLIVVSRRDEEPGQERVLETLAALPGVQELEINEINREAMITLACRHLGVSSLSPDFERVLLERAEGVPLVLEELTLLMRDAEWVVVSPEGVAQLAPDIVGTIPHGIREVVLARIERLDEGAQLTLKTASVMGRTFSLSLLREVYPVPFDFSVLTARLERVEGLDIVRQDRVSSRARFADESVSVRPGLSTEQTFFFKHALIRDTIYESIPASSRRSLHEAIAQALEKRLNDDNRSELVLAIAEHYRRTTRTDKQRIYLREAGDISRARGQNREALDYFQAAEQISQHLGNQEELVGLLEAQVAVLNLMGDRDRQREVIGRWKEVARELPDERFLADALRAEGSLLARSGETQRGLLLLEQSLRIARNHNDVHRIARTLRPLCRLYFLESDNDRALEAAEEALALTQKLQNLQDAPGDLANVGFILARMGRRSEGREKMEQALEQAQARGDVWRVGIILSNLGVLDWEDGRLDRALRFWDRALALKRQVGDREEEAISLNNMGIIALALGELNRAHDHCREALSISQQIELPWAEVSARENLAQVLAALGRTDDARREILAGLSLCQTSRLNVPQETLLTTLAELELRAGNLDAASEAIARARALVPHRVKLRTLDALCLHVRGEKTAAVQEAEGALEELEKNYHQSEKIYVLRYNLSVVLEEASQATSARLLQEARDALLSLAARVEDPVLRQQMLEQVPENRAILQAWERLESSIET